MRIGALYVLAVAMLLGGTAEVTAQDETIAASSVHNSPIIYSTLLPLAWSTESWALLHEDVFGPDEESILVEGIEPVYSSIALKPIDGNVMCRQVDVTYEDESTQTIELEREGVLNERQLYAIEFGVDPKHVTQLYLQCRAIGLEQADIAVYGEPAV